MTEESGKFDINSDSFLWLKLENNFAFIIISRGDDKENDKERGKHKTYFKAADSYYKS